MIGIRVDVNEQIASGHVMRCLSLAEALRACGETVVFFVSDSSAEEFVIKNGYRAICLHSDWTDKNGELQTITDFLSMDRFDLLIVDSYQVTEEYLKKLKEYVKLAYLDDLNAFDYPVDLVINYAIYATRLHYPSNKRYLLGTQYAPLRKQFMRSMEECLSDARYRNSNKEILVTTGATDPCHVAGQMIGATLSYSQLSDYKIVVIKGRFWPDSWLSTTSNNFLDRIEIHENVNDMASLMRRSSLAVSAGGSTLYELCACEVPTVTFSFADNQLNNVNTFAQKGIMEYAGDAREDERIGESIAEKLVKYHENPQMTDKMKEKMRRLDCANGADRLAAELVKFINECR